jgi:hypothetical protein
MIKNTLANWHDLLKDKDPKALQALLHDDVVFHSPVVHTPQHGKALTHMYLMAAFHVLEFQTVVDGITINGVDMITCDDAGLITDFKVMVRPLKAINLLHQKMMAMLEQVKSAS